MNFTTTFKTITQSKIFQQFQKQHQEAELVAGFFILDFLDSNNQRSLDYKSDSEIFTFSLNQQNEITIKQDKLIKNPKFPELTKISASIKIDLDSIPSIAEQEALNRSIKNKFQKIIAVLQMHNNQQIWNLTCMLEGLIILNILISSDTRDIIKFEKRSLADFVKKG